MIRCAEVQRLRHELLKLHIQTRVEVETKLTQLAAIYSIVCLVN